MKIPGFYLLKDGIYVYKHIYIYTYARYQDEDIEKYSEAFTKSKQAIYSCMQLLTRNQPKAFEP